MLGYNLRWVVLRMFASAGAGLLTLSSVMTPAFAYGDAPEVTDPTSGGIGLVMGGTGEPIPGTEYVDEANALYIEPNFPGTTYPGTLANGLPTPEGLSPLTGVNSLPLDTSVSEGVTILNNSIQANLAAGDVSTVFGSSQSAVISSLEMEALDPSGTPSTLPVNFVLIGDEMNPNGGILERFAGLDLASLGISFYGATPADDFPTDMYTAEYDGFADFPRYPIDLLSDLNAFFGLEYAQYSVPAQVATAIQLPTSGATETTYYMIPTTDLPLLDPVRDIPLIGNPIADLLQPDLTYIVNLGYGDPLYGWSTSAANVPTEFGLFPSLSDIEMMPGLLVSGAEEGIENFIGDFTGTGPNPVVLPSLSSLTSLLDPSSGTASADPLAALSAPASDPASTLTDLVNTLSSATSTAYGTVLSTADIANALLTSLPAYDVSLFVDNLQAGNLLDAVGLPIAADIGLGTFAAGIEYDVVVTAASTIIGDLASLIP